MPVLSRAAMTTGIEHAMAIRRAALAERDTYKAAAKAPPSAERICGAEGCAGGWSLPWKSRRRPVFEQEWGCSARCLAKLVGAAVRREAGDGFQGQLEGRHRHRIPLGLVLLAQGWITHPQLQAALEAQKANGRGRIGDWLTQGCGLEEDRVARGLSVQWNCPVLANDNFSPSAMALVMPKRLVAEFGLVPLRFAGSTLLYLAFEEQMDAATALGVEQMSGLKVESGLLIGAQFKAARAQVLAAEAAPVQIKAVGDTDALTAAIVKALEQRQPVATRLVRVHQYYWLRMWLETGAKTGVGNVPPSAEDVVDYLFSVEQK